MPAASSYEKYFAEQIQGKDAVLIGPGIPADSDKLGVMIRVAAQTAPVSKSSSARANATVFTDILNILGSSSK